MCGVDEGSQIGTHKELGGLRKIRDKMDVPKVVAVIKDSMVNPFDLAGEDNEPATLLNIATGVVMPPEKADQPIGAKQTGTARVEEFASKRLHGDAVSFWAKITKANVTTFASLSKKLKIKRTDEKWKP